MTFLPMADRVLGVLAGWLGQTPRLQEYTDKLTEMGCDTPEMMLDLTEEVLLEAGFTQFHRRRIVTNITGKANSTDTAFFTSPTSPGKGPSEECDVSELDRRLGALRSSYEVLVQSGSSERALSVGP